MLDETTSNVFEALGFQEKAREFTTVQTSQFYGASMKKLLIAISLFSVGIAFLACTDNTTTPSDTLTISGVVRDASSGNPMADVDVVAYRQGASSEVSRSTSDANGLFTLHGIPRVAIDIEASKNGYSMQRVENIDPSDFIDADNAAIHVRMVPDSAACCDGILTLAVRDAYSQPLHNVKVQLTLNGKSIEIIHTAANGLAIIDHLCPGSYALRLSAPGLKVEEVVFAINEQCDPVALTVAMDSVELCCTATFTLHVKNQSGAKLSGATVQLLYAGAILATDTTDSNGRVYFDELCTGAYTVLVSKQGFESRELHFTIGELCKPVEKVLVLENPASCCDGILTMIVRDDKGDPVKGASVKIMKGGVLLETPVTDANGSIVVDHLCNGEYSYRIFKEGWEVLEGVFAINATCDPVTLNVTLEKQQSVCCDGILTMIVRDKNGDPVHGASVKIMKGGVLIETPVTDGNGSVVVDHLCKGEYSYRVFKEGWVVLEGVFAINATCDPVTLNVTLEQQQSVCCDGILSMIVRDDNGDPVKGASVKIMKGGVHIETPVTDGNGSIVVDHLCVGEYSYRVFKEGWKVLEGVFAINATCDPVTVNVTLHDDVVCCTGVLTVIVKDDSNDLVEGAYVRLYTAGALHSAKQTDAAGMAVFTDLCAAKYGVDVKKSGFKTREFAFTINERCDPVSKTVELLP